MAAQGCSWVPPVEAPDATMDEAAAAGVPFARCRRAFEDADVQRDDDDAGSRVNVIVIKDT